MVIKGAQGVACDDTSAAWHVNVPACSCGSLWILTCLTNSSALRPRLQGWMFSFEPSMEEKSTDTDSILQDSDMIKLGVSVLER